MNRISAAICMAILAAPFVATAAEPLGCDNVNIGDEVMAMFEGPKRDQHACKASIEIRKAMAQEKSDLSHFGRTFKKLIGISPLRYRKLSGKAGR